MSAPPAGQLPASSLLQLIWLASPACPWAASRIRKGWKPPSTAAVTTEAMAARLAQRPAAPGLARGDLAVIAQAIPAWRTGDLDRIAELERLGAANARDQRAARAGRADGPIAARMAAQP
jgi:urease accessory protein